MSEEEQVEVVEQVVEEPEQLVEETVAVVEEPVVVVAEPKKKRKRSAAQVKALENARTKKAQKKRKILKKPLKVERKPATEAQEEVSFSWTKEIAKAGLLASLGLASVYVQQQFAQEQQQQQPVVVSETKTTTSTTTAQEMTPKKKQQQPRVPSKDPFCGFR